jgi:flavin reductase (DIM6/NTAB) family NADH-FMN oxidoreductase RutF
MQGRGSGWASPVNSYEQFESINPVDNFYQASAFIPMSFALVTTVHENGETGIGPHALLSPFSITKPYSMMLISRNNSGTATNIRRTGKCALNYIPFDREHLQGIANLGFPGMPLEDKQKANPYTYIDSPSPEKAADSEFPKIIGEAFQVFECTWDDRFDLHAKTDASGQLCDGHFNLHIDHILVKKGYVDGIDSGEVFPNMPIFYGYRGGRLFWFAKHEVPFSIPLPEVEGMEYQTVFYVANRIDANVRFTENACKKLTGIPQPFMKDALKEIVERAIKENITEVDETFLDKINAERDTQV